MNPWMGCFRILSQGKMGIPRFYRNWMRMMRSNRNIWGYESKSRKIQRGERNEHDRYGFKGTCC